MLRTILLAFVVVSLLELALLVWVGHRIGYWPLIAITLLLAVLGGRLARRQRQRAFADWQAALASGQPPVASSLEPMLVLASGALLVVPGLITDVIGLLLLIPPVREWAARWLSPRIARRSAALQTSLGPFAKPRRRADQPTVVDTEGEAVDGDPGPTALERSDR